MLFFDIKEKLFIDKNVKKTNKKSSFFNAYYKNIFGVNFESLFANF